MRTLVLDDDRIFLTVAEGLLYTLGLRGVRVTDNPDTARDLIAANEIDLALIDLNMPSLDGLAFLRVLSEHNYKGAVIVVSGEKSLVVSSARTLGKKLGLNVCGALSKPLDMEELKSCIAIARDEIRNRTPVEAPPETTGQENYVPELAYQLQHDLINRRACGYEALVRGRSEDGQLMSAAAILSNFTDKGERFNLTRQLFSLFCRDIRNLAAGGVNGRFSFNIDAAMLEHDDFVSMLMFTLTRFKMMPDRIVLELTESHLPENESVLLERIARLSMAGFEFSLDDFSTGASSFEILRAGAFSEVKLDRGLVQHSASDEASAKYIANMVEIAAALDLRLIAEGIETEADVVRMKGMGVRYLQGYFYGKPTAAWDIMAQNNTAGTQAHVA